MILVEFSNLTLELRGRRYQDSNVKFIPLAPFAIDQLIKVKRTVAITQIQLFVRPAKACMQMP
jgi:hypothetical protein